MEAFSQLTPEKKVESILATAGEPITKDFCLELADVDLDHLDRETVQRIDELFQQWKNPKQGTDGISLYWVPTEKQAAIIERIGVEERSVHERIGNLGMKEFGLE